LSPARAKTAQHKCPDTHWSKPRGAFVRLGLALMLAISVAACGGRAGPFSGGPRLSDLRPPPVMLPAASDSGDDLLLGGATFSIRDPALDWGVGVLRPTGANAFERVDLALFDAPNGTHWGWITQGKVYDQLRRRTLGDRTDATLLVSGARVFLVLEERSDGWLRIRYGHSDDRARGVAWTRADLSGGRRSTLLNWNRVFDGGRGIVFRNTASAHNLRAGPSRNAAVTTRLEGADFDMTVLEMRGDWMRVRVFSPPACAGSVAEDLLLGARSTVEQTGWITWRSNGRGPWVASASGPRCVAGA